MNDESTTKINKQYFLVVVLLMFVLPVLSITVECLINKPASISLGLIGKWFIFWAVGIRLLLAGFRQAINPSFTAKEIFHIDDKASYIIVRELGFTNICFGLIGVVSLFLPGWRIVSAFGSGLFYGIAGISHIVKRPVSLNEIIALISDIFIFLILLIYVLFM